MRFRSIDELATIGQVALTVAIAFAVFALPARAQRLPAESAAQAAAAQARHPASLPRFHPPPPVRPIQPVLPRPVSPLPLPFVPPRPAIPPVAGHAGVSPTPWRAPALHFPLLPKPALSGEPYCSPLSAVYNTGAICFNPDLFTINPAFLPIEPYVPPPLFQTAAGPISSFIPPALLLQYCATCATQPTGLPPANAVGGVKQPPISPPVVPSGPPLILVLKNGTMPLVGRYWLGSDWLIHYVGIDGQPGVVPPDMLNLKATGKINFQRGVVFSLPGWPDP